MPNRYLVSFPEIKNKYTLASVDACKVLIYQYDNIISYAEVFILRKRLPNKPKLYGIMRKRTFGNSTEWYWAYHIHRGKPMNTKSNRLQANL